MLVSVLCFASCITQKDDYRNFETAPLFGMVYDNDNQPCAGVSIIVDGQEGSVSDINGRFIVADLARGSHKISTSKEGYEVLDVSLEFLNKSQVLYLQIISFDQLLAKAERALEQGDAETAKRMLDRAAEIQSGNPVLLFLTAAYYREKTAYDEAVAVLRELLDSGHESKPVYLLLADIYQYDLDDADAAREILLPMAAQDKDIQQRIDEIDG